jgi:hypothetical protein
MLMESMEKFSTFAAMGHREYLGGGETFPKHRLPLGE